MGSAIRRRQWTGTANGKRHDEPSLERRPPAGIVRRQAGRNAELQVPLWNPRAHRSRNLTGYMPFRLPPDLVLDPERGFRIYEGVVAPDWTDRNGHMNVVVLSAGFRSGYATYVEPHWTLGQRQRLRVHLCTRRPRHLPARAASWARVLRHLSAPRLQPEAGPRLPASLRRAGDGRRGSRSSPPPASTSASTWTCAPAGPRRCPPSTTLCSRRSPGASKGCRSPVRRGRVIGIRRRSPSKPVPRRIPVGVLNLPPTPNDYGVAMKTRFVAGALAGLLLAVPAAIAQSPRGQRRGHGGRRHRLHRVRPPEA